MLGWCGGFSLMFLLFPERFLGCFKLSFYCHVGIF
jgi:hypothetical protein